MGLKKNLMKMIGCVVKQNNEPDLSMLEYYEPQKETLSIREMAETAVHSLESLKAQTECCRKEIEMLRTEIRELRREHINRSLNSTDTGFSGSAVADDELEISSNLSDRSSNSQALWRAEAAMHAKLYEAVEVVARRVPQFLDYPTEV